ncbi:MAG: hypothetical protein CM1200mP14_11910 [Gammaproteobacteria bacterium]|nr:MAG: hypothetical protein CM1200mP14_11910 [Gammaproteobacteria bacterium]
MGQNVDLRFRITTEPREHEALTIVENVLASGTPHVLLYCRNDDRAADIGDYLTLHGYPQAPPVIPKFPVWLGVNPLEVRSAILGTPTYLSSVATYQQSGRS